MVVHRLYWYVASSLGLVARDIGNVLLIIIFEVPSEAIGSISVLNFDHFLDPEVLWHKCSDNLVFILNILFESLFEYLC